MERKKGFVLVLTFVVLASLTFMASARANEIWITPSGLSLFPSGNWSASSYPSATFSFAVPNNMTAFESAKLVVIGKVSGILTYSLGLSIAGSGDPQNYYTDSAAGLKAALTKNQLQEIDISSYIPTGKKPGGFAIEPGDYIGLNFQFYLTNAVNVLGLRFQYEGPMGPQGEKGEKGDKGDKGDSPVLTWSEDQIVIDGVAGPHLTGPQGPPGPPGAPASDTKAVQSTSVTGYHPQTGIYTVPYLIPYIDVYLECPSGYALYGCGGECGTWFSDVCAANFGTPFCHALSFQCVGQPTHTKIGDVPYPKGDTVRMAAGVHFCIGGASGNPRIYCMKIE